MADSQSFDFNVRSSVRDYSVEFVDSVSGALSSRLAPGDVVLIDRHIQQQYGEQLAPVLERQSVVAIDATESQKSYAEIGPLIERLIELRVRKNNRLVAIGGGITQDVAGFVASILYRGISWVFVPTTLLAQSDSCIGAKTSINIGAFKNQLGGFYPPELILIDPGFLRTLPERELWSGLGEMAHYYYVAGEEDFEFFREHFSRAPGKPEVLRKLIARSLGIKKRYIEADEFDRGERQVLNYGHSFGHALESVTNYRVPHGIAVSYGIDMANFVSVQLGYLPERERNRMREPLANIWKSVPAGEIDQAQFEAALRRDKKNVGDKLGLILTRGLGTMFKDLQPLDERFSGWLREYFSAMGKA